MNEPSYFCLLHFYYSLCRETQCVYCDALRPWPLVRLADTPVFRIYWYYYLHQDMYCPTFVVLRMEYTFCGRKVKIRGITFAEEWRGTYAK